MANNNIGPDTSLKALEAVLQDEGLGLQLTWKRGPRQWRARIRPLLGPGQEWTAYGSTIATAINSVLAPVRRGMGKDRE